MITGMITFDEYVKDCTLFVKNSPKVHNIVIKEAPNSQVLTIVEWRSKVSRQFDFFDVAVGTSQKDAKSKIAQLCSAKVNPFEMQKNGAMRYLADNWDFWDVADAFDVPSEFVPPFY